MAFSGKIQGRFPHMEKNLGQKKPPHQSSWSRPKLDKPYIEPYILTRRGKI
jgi:hypothetical protein